VNDARTPLVTMLLEVLEKGGDVDLRAAVGRSASESEGNVRAAELLEIGHVHVPETGIERIGLKIRNKPYLLSEVAYAVENSDLPDYVGEQLPDLSQDEWAAAMRMVVLILLELEGAPAQSARCS